MLHRCVINSVVIWLHKLVGPFWCLYVALFGTTYTYQKGPTYTGLFISPSGISELDCATTKTDTAERSISIGRESLQVFFLY